MRSAIAGSVAVLPKRRSNMGRVPAAGGRAAGLRPVSSHSARLGSVTIHNPDGWLVTRWAGLLSEHVGESLAGRVSRHAAMAIERDLTRWTGGSTRDGRPTLARLPVDPLGGREDRTGFRGRARGSRRARGAGQRSAAPLGRVPLPP